MIFTGTDFLPKSTTETIVRIFVTLIKFDFLQEHADAQA